VATNFSSYDVAIEVEKASLLSNVFKFSYVSIWYVLTKPYSPEVITVLPSDKNPNFQIDMGYPVISAYFVP